MILEPVTILELAALGLTGGFMAGLLGVGGGMVLVPFIVWILTGRGVEDGLAVKMAIATSMATIMFTSISSMRAHHKRGMVRWDLVKGIAPGIMIGALVVSLGVFALLKGAWLSVVFGVLVIGAASQMFLDRKPKPTRQMPQRPGQMAAGSVIGFLSGLLGAGGGFLSVPFMTWCNVAIHNAVATSSALGFPIAIFNVFGYVISGWSVVNRPALSVGYVWLPALAVIVCCSVLTAPLGARTAHALPVKTLKRIFAMVLMLLAISMLMQGLRLLGWR